MFLTPDALKGLSIETFLQLGNIQMKKYEFTNETQQVGDATLYRIRALRGFGDVKASDLGGFIEKEDNLSHDGICWVYNYA